MTIPMHDVTAYPVLQAIYDAYFAHQAKLKNVEHPVEFFDWLGLTLNSLPHNVCGNRFRELFRRASRALDLRVLPNRVWYAEFCFDAEESERFNGYTDGTLWNGWETPLIHQAEMKRFAALYNEGREPGQQRLSYDPVSGGWTHLPDAGSDDEPFGLEIHQHLTVDGHVVEGYDLGPLGLTIRKYDLIKGAL